MVSPFLPMPADRVVACNDLAFAIRDGFPVSAGHTLVITERLVPTWFEATREEQLAILELVDEVKAQLDAELRRLGPAELECEGGWARRRCGDRAGTFCRASAPRCGAAGRRQKAVDATGLAAPRPSRGGGLDCEA